MHGLPFEIVSNMDKKFISEFWTTLFELCGTKIKLSIAYYRLTKKTNRTLEDMLRMHVGKR
jgi:hypothetical protein